MSIQAQPQQPSFIPEHFFDRTEEQKLFEQILRCEEEARLLTICDTSGKGKSQLLEQLRFKCRFGPQGLPVSLVALDELKHKTADEFVLRLVVALREQGLDFPTYTEIVEKRLEVLGQGAPTGLADIQTMFGGKAAGVIVEAGATAHFHGNALPTDLDEQLRRSAVLGFLEDLRTYCETERAVLLIDAYEHCTGELEHFVPSLLQTYAVPTRRLHNLIIVIAGQRVPSMTLKMIFEDSYEQVVREVGALSVWEREHVEAFLDVHLDSHDDDDVEYLLKRLRHEERAWSIANALSFTTAFARQGG